MRDRAYRRHQLQKRKRRARGYYGGYLNEVRRDGRALVPEPEKPRHVGIIATTPQRCSGYCCGNPRKWFGEPTIQERRAGIERE